MAANQCRTDAGKLFSSARSIAIDAQVAFGRPVLAQKGITMSPEDVGGPHGYEMFLNILGDRDHEQHEDMVRWIGGVFVRSRGA
jgi:hypothetical protein